MKIQFSQKRFKGTEIARQVHALICSCVTSKYRQGLLVKVMFYTDPELKTYWRGNYRDIYHHGLYDNEWDMKGVESVMTLKVGPEVPRDKLLYLIAHETGHHIIRSQDRRGGEKKADKVASQIIARVNKKKKENDVPQ